MARIRPKRGLKANLPTTGLLAGEFMITTDQGTPHVATSATTSIPVVPAIFDLANLPAIDMAADLIMIGDASEVGSVQKLKSMTGNALKAAMNIPAMSSDEKTAAAPGGVANFLYNTTGADGVLRAADNSLAVSLGPAGAYMAFSVDIVDGGTF
jgi:hypothetical protein